MFDRRFLMECFVRSDWHFYNRYSSDCDYLQWNKSWKIMASKHCHNWFCWKFHFLCHVNTVEMVLNVKKREKLNSSESTAQKLQPSNLWNGSHDLELIFLFVSSTLLTWMLCSSCLVFSCQHRKCILKKSFWNAYFVSVCFHINHSCSYMKRSFFVVLFELNQNILACTYHVFIFCAKIKLTFSNLRRVAEWQGD